MNYLDLYTQLGSKELKRINSYTSLELGDNGVISVRFYDTRVVKIYPDGSYVLNTDGYFNSRTTSCMNEYLKNVYVHSRKGDRICTINHIDFLYQDNMRIAPDGSTEAIPYIIHEINEKTDSKVSTLAEVIQLIEGSTIEAIKILWRKCTYSKDRIAYYAPLVFIPMILPRAKGNEYWYRTAANRLTTG